MTRSRALEPAAAALPYRPCVGLMLLDGGGRIFAGQRIDNPAGAWQMPQGGIDAGETPRDAALRELREETGIPPALVQVLRESAHWLRYDLPPDLVGRLWKGRYGGQEQRWFALRFLGSDADVDIGSGEPEFREWAWLGAGTLLDNIVPFKRDTYARVLAEFADLL